MKEKEKYREERKEVAYFMRRLYDRGLTTTSGGNLSMRVTEDLIVITPSATDKGKMKWKEIGIVSLKGENLSPALKPSIELNLHLGIYKKHKEINAIVHAHPVFASSFTAMKGTIDTSLTAEARAICGVPKFVPYALMGSAELAGLAAKSSEEADILLLENHGILTMGRNLLQAFDKIEVLENAAKMTLITMIAGGKRALTTLRLREIDSLFR